MNNFLIRNTGFVKSLLLSIVFLIVSSKVIIPLYPVPITLQMFAIYFLGLLLPSRESFFLILSWLFIGSIGFPVFASNLGGISGPTVGYLIGMLFGAPMIGFLKSKGFSNLVSCIACYLIVHIFGCLWLVNFVGIDNVIQLGVVLFIIPELLKITLACSIFSLKK